MDFSFFKRHPYLTGGVIVVGGVIMFVIISSGSNSSSSASSGTNSALAAAQLTADNQYRIAQLNANTQSQAIDAGIEAKNIDSATAIEMATFAHDIEALKLGVQESLGLGAIDSQNQMTAASLEGLKLQTSAAMEQAQLNFREHAFDLQRQSEADAIALQNAQLQRNFEAEGRMLQYNLNLYDEQTNRDTQTSLIGVIDNLTTPDPVAQAA